MFILRPYVCRYLQTKNHASWVECSGPAQGTSFSIIRNYSVRKNCTQIRKGRIGIYICNSDLLVIVSVAKTSKSSSAEKSTPIIFSCILPGTDVVIIKIFSPKKIGVLTHNKAKLCKNLIIKLVFEKTPIFFRRKLAKIAENCDHNIDPCLCMCRYISSIFQDFPPCANFLLILEIKGRDTSWVEE
jgi:hypothetical protein